MIVLLEAKLEHSEPIIQAAFLPGHKCTMAFLLRSFGLVLAGDNSSFNFLAIMITLRLNGA